MKSLVILISGAPEGDNLREVEIEPGTTVGDVTRELELNDFLISREGSAQAFAAEENLYAAIDDGQKLRATPIAEVGAGFWESLLVGLGLIEEPVRVRQVGGRQSRVRRLARLARPNGGRAGLRVERDRRPLWQVRGWRRNGKRMTGAFRTPRGSFAGEISLKNPQRPEYFIVNPPRRLLKGPHRACFRSRGKGKFYVHFGRSQADVDAGIVALEKLIVQALA